MRFFWSCASCAFVVTTLFAGQSTRAPTEFVEVGTAKQLFVDDYVIERMPGVERSLGRVTKENGARAIFEAGRFYGSVRRDGDRFQMWYRLPSGDGYGYAESSDGLKFESKGKLSGINFAGDYNLAVELNRPGSDSAHRYLGGYDAPGMAAGIAVSRDGTHWTPLNDGKPVTYRAADCHNQILWDGAARTYRLFTRTDFGAGGGPVAYTAAKDFEVRGTRSMTNADIHAAPGRWETVSEWWFHREGPKEYLRRQIYSMTVWIYEGVYFGLLSVYEYPGDISEGRESDHVRRHDRDVMEFYIATSRDCASWDLQWVYAGRPIVPRGPPGSFDKDSVFPSSTVVTFADKHWLYYSGSNERHGTAELEPPVWFERTATIGVATLRLDGFVGLHVGHGPGEVVTRPFRLAGERLVVNVDAKAGSLRVEILDVQEQPILGFSGYDAKTYTRIDDIRFEPKWTRPLRTLRGRVVRLRFHLEQADLYSFQVQ